jgi:hypothetical protein
VPRNWFRAALFLIGIEAISAGAGSGRQGGFEERFRGQNRRKVESDPSDRFGCLIQGILKAAKSPSAEIPAPSERRRRTGLYGLPIGLALQAPES